MKNLVIVQKRNHAGGKEKMNNQIYITNGMARCGKDTFAQILDEIVPTLKYSSIDKVKSIAKQCG